MLKQYLSNQAKRPQQITIALVILLVTAMGTYLLISGYATTPYASVKADTGSLGNGASSQLCPGSSDGSCVVFNGSTTTAGKDEGKSRYKLDASSFFDSFGTARNPDGTATNGPWVKANVTVFEGYSTFSDQYINLYSKPYGIPLISYRDPAYPPSSVTGLDASQIQTYADWADSEVKLGYAGVFVDDANWKSGASPGPPAQLAALMTAMRAKDPNILIEMNSQYHDMWPIMQNPSDPDYPYVEQALSAVNIICKEFGVGPTSGINNASDYASFMQFVKTLHTKGLHIDMTGDYHNRDAATIEYNLATYFLVSDGSDLVGGDDPTSRTAWTPRFNVDLGNATSAEQRSSNGVWTRSFVNGAVYTVEPGASTQTINLPTPMKDVNTGSTVSSVTLSPASGVVLMK